MNRKRKSAPLCTYCGAPCVGGQTDLENRPAHFTCQASQTNQTELEADE